MDEVRNYGLACVHPVYRSVHRHFKGTLVEMKAAAMKMLEEHGPGWAVKAGTDGQVIWCQQCR